MNTKQAIISWILGLVCLIALGLAWIFNYLTTIEYAIGVLLVYATGITFLEKWRKEHRKEA